MTDCFIQGIVCQELCVFLANYGCIGLKGTSSISESLGVYQVSGCECVVVGGLFQYMTKFWKALL